MHFLFSNLYDKVKSLYTHQGTKNNKVVHVAGAYMCFL